MHSDASSFAIGGWLGQIHLFDGKKVEFPVVYWSRKLTPAERRYAVHDLELLAMKEFITRFPMFLFGQKFHAVVDHRSLEYLLSQPHLTDRQIRTIEKLARYDFTVEY